MSLCDIEIFKTAVVQKWGPIKLGQWLICHKEPLVNYNQRSNDLFEWYLDFPSFFLFGRDLRKSPLCSLALRHIGGAISATWSLRFGLDLLFLSQPAVSLRLQLLTRRSTPVVTRQSRGGSADHGLFPWAFVFVKNKVVHCGGDHLSIPQHLVDPLKRAA